MDMHFAFEPLPKNSPQGCPKVPELFHLIRTVEEFDSFLCKYLPSVHHGLECAIFNAYALSLLV